MVIEKIKRHQGRRRNKLGILGRKTKGKRVMRRFRSFMADLARREEVYMIITRRVSNTWRTKPPTSSNYWFDSPELCLHPGGPRIRTKLCTARAEQVVEIRFTDRISGEECLRLFA